MKIYLATLFIFLGLQWSLSQSKDLASQKTFLSPSKNVSLFAFGYQDALASLMWVRLLQDFHICDQNSERTPYPEWGQMSDRLTEVIERELPRPTCERGWVFQMLDVISDLQPNFEAAYLDGATMLSVMVDDRVGAQEIFHKGLKIYPDDWNLLYRSAYHELFEMQNPEEAQRLLIRAGQRGAPAWVYSLAAKLYTRQGQGAFALSILEQVLERDRGGQFSARIEAQIKKIRETLNLPQ